jgi:hypothetical protein
MDRLDFLLAAERWGGGFLLVSALAAPFVLPAVATALRRRSPGRQSGAVRTGCVAALLYSPLALVFAVCHGAYLGDPPRAQVGFQWAAPVLGVLEGYRRDHGQYPDSLSALVPRYVGATRELRLPARGRFSRGPLYERAGDGYRLSFEYIGPGVNACEYTATARRWSCGGYF